jgi:sulfatase maturation enzyme AslB (radical SAM superfamily)
MIFHVNKHVFLKDHRMAERFVCSKLFTDLVLRMHLGHIHNCCVTKPNPSEFDQTEFDALGMDYFTHNAAFLARKRSMLLDNRLPAACSVCSETHPNSFFSKWNQWTDESLPSSAEDLLTKDSFTWFEIGTSKACDLSCVYCSPKYSSTWAKELGLPTNDVDGDFRNKILTRFYQYLEAKSWDEDVLYRFCFAGGEPTYDPETLNTIDYLLNIVPHANLKIIIISNINTKSEIFERYMEKICTYTTVQWEIQCSLDGLEERCEAIRYGLDWSRAMRNLDGLLACEGSLNIHVCPSHNLLSVPYLPEYYRYFTELFQKHGRRLEFGSNMVMYGGFSVRNLTPRYRRYFDESLQYLEAQRLWTGSLANARQIIGTTNSAHDLQGMIHWWEYMQNKRPNIKWQALFPHVDEVIGELQELNHTQP